MLTLQSEINIKIQEYIRLVEQKREEVQRQSEEVQRQIRLSEELNELVLRQIDNTRELKRQLGI
jgi:hypothetical protein